MAEKYKLKLYILGSTPLSNITIENAKKICETELKGKYKLDIIDLKEHMQLAEDEKIFATPTFEKTLPKPLRRIIGDLSNKEKVLLGLNIVKNEEVL
jgi:circadian clock protein KaiB